MEVIRISGYTENEKVQIARNYLIPRQLKENGLLPDEAQFTEEAVQTIIRSYTREAGVRNLEREIGGVCRKIATKLTENGPVDHEISGQDVRTAARPPALPWAMKRLRCAHRCQG